MRDLSRYKLLFAVMFSLLSFSGSAQQLEDYIEKSLENNAGLKASYAQFEAALQQMPQVSSLPDPTMTVGAFGKMMEMPMGQEKASISLIQMFPWFGTLKAKESKAALLADAKFQAYLDVRNELVYKVSQQYFALYELNQRIGYQEDNLDILENYRQLSLAKVRGGSGALSDVLRIDLLKKEALTQVEILKLQKKSLQEQFYANLNWRDEDGEVNLPEDLELEFQELYVETDSNPKIAEADKMIAASKAQEEIAEKSAYPSLGLGVDYIVLSKTPGSEMMGPGNGEDSFMPMISISLPIFRKKFKAARKEAQLLQESFVHQKKQLEQNLAAEYAAALIETQKAWSLMELNEKQVETTNQVLQLLLSAYANASAGFEEVLDVQQNLLTYQLELAQAETIYYTAVARINYLTGNSLNNEDQQ